jgi:hypothetical protein
VDFVSNFRFGMSGVHGTSSVSQITFGSSDEGTSKRIQGDGYDCTLTGLGMPDSSFLQQ